MVENDGLIPPRFDQMGEFFHYIDTAEHGLGLGTHTKRPFMDEQYRWGDYTITYEIRRSPLPDLRPVNIKVNDLPSRPEKQVCAAVQNAEAGAADAFEVIFRVDGIMPGGGRTAALAPSPGNHVDVCAELALPSSGRHTLSAHVDETRDVVEFNEANNVHEQIYEPAGASAAPTPTPLSSAALPDLIVTAIKVNGQIPDGKDDCKAGKNDVMVVVKNQGKAKAGDFYVRLVADDDQGGAREEGLADGLDVGKEVSVTFEGVRLKEGPHTLTATADWRTGTGIAESDETNNTLKVAASCKDDD